MRGEVEIGVGSDIRGRTEGEEEEEAEDEMGPEPAAWLAGFGAPAPSLASEVRLAEFACSSGWVTVWDF